MIVLKYFSACFSGTRFKILIATTWHFVKLRYGCCLVGHAEVHISSAFQMLDSNTIDILAVTSLQDRILHVACDSDIPGFATSECQLEFSA